MLQSHLGWKGRAPRIQLCQGALSFLQHVDEEAAAAFGQYNVENRVSIYFFLGLQTVVSLD